MFAGGKAALWIDATSGAGLLYDKSQSIDRAAAGSADEKRNALEFDYTRVLGGALNPSIHGEMSMVGPRPCTPPEFRFYQPWQQERVNAATRSDRLLAGQRWNQNYVYREDQHGYFLCQKHVPPA